MVRRQDQDTHLWKLASWRDSEFFILFYSPLKENPGLNIEGQAERRWRLLPKAHQTRKGPGASTAQPLDPPECC